MTRRGVCGLCDFSWCNCLNVNFDFGMRRGEVMEKGEEAKMGAGEDILAVSEPFRACLRLSKAFSQHLSAFQQDVDIKVVVRRVSAIPSRVPAIPCMRVIHLPDPASRNRPCTILPWLSLQSSLLFQSLVWNSNKPSF